MQILIATDGSARTTNSIIQFVALFARPAAATVTLLGIAETPGREAALREKLESARATTFEGSGCDVSVRIRRGAAEEEILAETAEHRYHLVVIGWLQRRGIKRFVLGSVARYLGQRVPVPLLVVSEPHAAIDRVLICTSGEIPGEVDARVGGMLAALVKAEVTVLHVMSQLALIPDAPIEDLERDAPELIREGSREGKHLQRVLDILADEGVAPEKRHAKVRHGLVLDEIIGEAREGNYDLIVIGAHLVPRDRRWPRLRAILQENMADHILTHIRRPVLIARALNDQEWTSTMQEERETLPADRRRRPNVGE